MAAQLAAAFLVGAFGPLRYASKCLMTDRVAEGLRELSPESLHGGFRRGLEEAANRAGIPLRVVETALPMSDVHALAERLRIHQLNAVEAWGLHAGHLGGFLKGVADLTVDARAPDVGLCLERLANKVIRDPPLAEPLLALAADVSAWQDIIARCREVLDDSGALARAYRKRRLKTMGGAALACIGGAAAMGLAIHVVSTRARIEAAITNTDACVASSLSAIELDRASADQRRRIAERAAICEEGRRSEELAREEARKSEERVREEAQVRSAREAKCLAMAARAASGSMPDADGLATDEGALLRRALKGPLEPADLGPAEPKLPCSDTRSGPLFSAIYAKGVLAAPALWAHVEDPSAAVRAILVSHRDTLPGAAKQVLARRAERAAQGAFATTPPTRIPRAAHLCELKVAFGLGRGGYCAKALALQGAER